MRIAKCIVFSLLLVIVSSQRGFYAGNRPIGFPTIDETTLATSTDDLGDRLGSVSTITTERLPVEALGDINLIKRLQKMPLDKQPFWFINWKALEENRNKPQAYSLRQNSYLDPIPVAPPRLRWFERFRRYH